MLENVLCGVPKLEGGMREMPPLSKIVGGIEKFMAKKSLILMDNNVVASPRLKEIIDEVVDLGLQKGHLWSTLKQVIKFKGV